MSLSRASKEEQVSGIRDQFVRSTSAVFLQFQGLDVDATTTLRNEFRKAGVEYRVIKNSLLKLAVKGTPLDGNKAFTGKLTGPTGVAFSFEDPSVAAKIVKEFRKDDLRAQRLTVKCGVIDNAVLDGARVESELATMPGKDELRAMLLATLMAPAQCLVRQLSAPGQNFAYLADARRRQLENNG
jgi:large subunit ribosomal protein L10